MLIPVPEGRVAKRILQFFWLLDCSASMSGTKIATLNRAVKEVLPEITAALNSHPEVQIQMRAIRFSSKAEWHVGPEPVPLDKFRWPELKTGGTTATAQAIQLLTQAMDIDKMPRRGLPPVCLLVSDGYCTDSEKVYEQALHDLLALPWGRKSVRLAIAIGQDSEYDENQLLKFVSHPDTGVLKAYTIQQLVYYIKWASVTATVSASLGMSTGGSVVDGSVALPVAMLPSPQPMLADGGDIF